MYALGLDVCAIEKLTIEQWKGYAILLFVREPDEWNIRMEYVNTLSNRSPVADEISFRINQPLWRLWLRELTDKDYRGFQSSRGLNDILRDCISGLRRKYLVHSLRERSICERHRAR